MKFNWFKFNQFIILFHPGLLHLKYCLWMDIKALEVSEADQTEDQLQQKISLPGFHKLLSAWTRTQAAEISDFAAWGRKDWGPAFSTDNTLCINDYCLLFPGHTMLAIRINARKYLKKTLKTNCKTVLSKAIHFNSKSLNEIGRLKAGTRWVETTHRVGLFPSPLRVISKTFPSPASTYLYHVHTTGHS